MGSEKDLVRRVRGSFAAGVTVITPGDAGGGPRGCTARAVSSLALEPESS